MKIEIRNAESKDLDRINDIYNYYVRTSTCTFQIDDETMSSRIKWFDRRSGKYPVTVAINEHKVLGWGAISRFKERAAYENTAELSVYVDHLFHHRGIGEKLLMDLLEKAKRVGFHTLISIISADQAPSIRLHEKYGFSTDSRLKEVGHKFGKWLDVIYMQIILTHT